MKFEDFKLGQKIRFVQESTVAIGIVKSITKKQVEISWSDIGNVFHLKGAEAFKYCDYKEFEFNKDMENLLS